MRSLLLVVTSVVTALVVLTACGDSGVKSAPTADEAVKSAYDHTAAAKTAKVAVTATAPGAAQTSVTGTGAVDFAANTTTLRLNLPDAGAVDFRQIGSVVFERGAAVAAAGGGRWIKSDAAALVDDAGALLAEHVPPSPDHNVQPPTDVVLLPLAVNPTSTVAFFKGTVEGVGYKGSATVRGVATTHYYATVDLSKAAGAAGPPPPNSFSWLVEARGGSPFLGVDVWLDRSGTVRQQRFTLPRLGSTNGTPSAEKPGFTVTEQFFDFGTPVHVSAPPAAQTEPLQQAVRPSPTGTPS